MNKKCTICEDEATLQIKGNAAYYCDECAIDCFGDVSVLVKVEQDAQHLKRFIELQDEDRTD